MDQLHLLLLLCFSMLIGSFFSGTVPMAFKMSDSKSRLLALLGSGILVGTALAIIIPEGIDSLYGQTGNSPPPIIESNLEGPNAGESSIHEPVKTWIIGFSLVAGFVLMLLVDQFSIYQNQSTNHNHNRSSSNSRSQGHEYVLANGEEEDFEAEDSKSANGIQSESSSETKLIRDIDNHRSVVSMRALERENQFNDPHRVAPNNRPSSGRATKVTPTLGLVIHASADGIALGAAATTSHRDVEMIIFLAIMLHKAPAAFSLVVFLLHRGLSHATVRRHLLAFSLSAPLAALVTYFGLSQSGKEALRQNNATGIAMLFSAGTFLYVATVHVLPELVNNKLLTPKELLFLVGGTFLPLLLAQTI